MKPISTSLGLLAVGLCVVACGAGARQPVSCSRGFASSLSSGSGTCHEDFDCFDPNTTTTTKYTVDCMGDSGNYACKCIKSGAVTKTYTSVDFCGRASSTERLTQAGSTCGFTLE